MLEKRMEKKLIKKILYYVIVFICVLLICLTGITTAALIPQNKIADNSKISAEYYAGIKQFEQPLIENEKNTIIDNYADAVILNIIYCLDSSTPLKSSVCAEFYSNDQGNVITSYKEVTENNNKPNSFYSRYWHGTMIILKPLLMITDIHGIRIVNIILLTLLTGILSFLLIKEKQQLLCISLLLGMFFTSSYIVPFCIEYMSAFAIALICSIACILAFKSKEKYLGTIFLVSGMLVCFFDFLTCETLTFTVPALITLVLYFQNKRMTKFKEGLFFIIKNGVLWICGYAFMFISKWMISFIYLKEEAFKEAAYNAVHRIGGNEGKYTGLAGNRIFKNFVNINIFNNTQNYGDLVLRILIIILVLFSIAYLYKKKEVGQSGLFKVLCIIMIIPYVRYFVLNNHSGVHYYFTYRAQLPAIISGIYMILTCIDFKFIKKKLTIRSKNYMIKQNVNRKK